MIGISTVQLRIFASNSLKDKRRLVKSLITRMQHKFKIAIAEVDSQNCWNEAVICFAVVANDFKYIDSVITKVLNQMEQEFEIITETREYISP